LGKTNDPAFRSQASGTGNLADIRADTHISPDMKIGTLGNLIIMGTLPIRCPVCGATIPACEVHRHDGPLELEAEWHDPESGRIAELWVTAIGEAE
jgi:hypothetical protein